MNEITNETTYYWTASNNSSFLNGTRTAKTMIGAVRAARRYLRYELYGEGIITISTNNDPESMPTRTDELSMFTNYNWKTTIF